MHKTYYVYGFNLIKSYLCKGRGKGNLYKKIFDAVGWREGYGFFCKGKKSSYYSKPLYLLLWTEEITTELL